MKKVCIFLATGFEECEALLVVDMLRRAKIEAVTASITGERTVVSSHNVPVVADALAEELDLAGFDVLVLPGGVPGTPNLKASKLVCDALTAQYNAGKRVAAICAAPSVLASLGMLEGKPACVHQCFRDQMAGAVLQDELVVTSGNVTTACGLGAGIAFGLELVRLLADDAAADQIAHAISYGC